MDASLLLDLYRQMALCRRFEEAAGRAYQQGKIRGFLHLYVGQEAVAVGAISGAAPTDYIVSTYREHAHYLARTGDARGAMAELFGKAAAWSAAAAARCTSSTPRSASSVGGRSSAATFRSPQASRSRRSIRDEPDVTLCFFGDGTANMGAFHEGLALAGLWKLPSSSSARTTCTRWARRSTGRSPSRTSRSARAAIRSRRTS
jgi:pyruvate dehydrogenase E1 component alpha subunit